MRFRIVLFFTGVVTLFARKRARRGPEISWLQAKLGRKDIETVCESPAEHGTHLLSASVACCYARIVKNSSCCMDQAIAAGVHSRHIQRPGMHWECNAKNCYDTVMGKRGKDTIWVPDGATCSSPRILYTHGGSWMYGSPDTDSYAQLGSKLAQVSGAMVMVTDYPLVPAGNYSTILQWAVSALQWLEKNGPYEDCPSDSSAPLFVGGDSSGGGTTMSLVLTLQEKPWLLQKPLSGAFFFSPWTNLMCNTPEYYSNAFSKIEGQGRFKDNSKLQMYTGDIMFQEDTPENADAFSGNAVEYLGGQSHLQTDPIASPFFAGPAQFSGKHMPPMFITVGASESILGDSIWVAQAAAQGGADVILEVYHGMWHVFPMYSEGCGSGEELWAGANAINSTGLFVRHIVSTGRLPYKIHLEGPHLGPPESGILAQWWEPNRSKVPVYRHMYDPSINRFVRVGELMPNTDAAYGYKDFVHDMAKQSPWIVLPSITGAAVAIFAAGFFLGGAAEYGGERAVKRYKRVSTFRRLETAPEINAPLLEADTPAARAATFRVRSRRPSFMVDFVKGVPEIET